MKGRIPEPGDDVFSGGGGASGAAVAEQADVLGVEVEAVGTFGRRVSDGFPDPSAAAAW